MLTTDITNTNIINITITDTTIPAIAPADRSSDELLLVVALGGIEINESK